MECRRSVACLLLPLFATALCMAACSKSDTKDDSTGGTGTQPSKIAVYVVNYPLEYFADRIGGGDVEVMFPAPSDGDPAFWIPDAETIVAYQKADLILLNGATYAKWVDKVSLPESKRVDTSAGFADRYIVIEDAVAHSHGPGGEHAHAGTAFTTWIDFSQAVQQARTITDALGRLRPSRRAAFEENFAALEKDLLSLEEDINTVVADKRDQPLLASHPVYQYFARRYKLHIESVTWEPEEVPDEGHWRELETIVESHPAKWMIWEGDPHPKSVKRLSEMGIGSVVFDPCGNTPEDGDFMNVMRGNIENLRSAFE
jgi:zinc transport system substrate-binding protein